MRTIREQPAHTAEQGRRTSLDQRSRLAAVVLGLAAVLGFGGVYVTDQLAGARPGRTIRYRPADATPRLQPDTGRLPAALSIRDFDGSEDRLYLLDPLTPAVHVVERAAAGWQVQNSFGRGGGGPGEFSNPTGLAALPDGRVAVIEPGRIHFFGPSGNYLESRAPALPCAIALPRLSAARNGLFIHGSCMRGGSGRDTMAAVLLWSADGGDFRMVASDPRFTTDGSFGSAYGSDVVLSDGARHHLFGAGSSHCVFRVLDSGEAPQVERVCEPRWRSYRLDLSSATRAELETTRRRHPLLGEALRIPTAHSAYVQRLALRDGDALVRGFAEDSVVVRRLDDGRDLAVLPLTGLVACRLAGCLYAVNDLAGVRLGLVTAALLDSLSRSLARGTQER